MSVASDSQHRTKCSDLNQDKGLVTETGDAKDTVWDEAHARHIVHEFTAWSDKIIRARTVKDEKEKQAALAKVASAVSNSELENKSSKVPFWTEQDSQKLATEAEAYAASAIAQLRLLAKNKKVRNKENAASWSVLLQKTSKLTPEGAAEMARATVAAAEAAAAMRKPVEKEVSKVETKSDARNKQQLCNAGVSSKSFTREFDIVPYSNSAFRAVESGEEKQQDPVQPPEVMKDKDVPRARTLRKKTVEFAADTIFEKPKRR